jgi:hypothetical protein
VLWSEYRAEIPRSLDYARILYGFPSFEVEESNEILGPGGSKSVRHRWAVRDVPALREEPFLTTLHDHAMRMDFQLAAYLHPGQGPVQELTTWEDLATRLAEHPYFGRQVTTRALRQQAATVTTGLSDPEAKMNAIYDFLRTSITPSGRRGFLASENLDAVLRTKSGSVPEINLLLLAMLRGAGPVLISTRSNGRLLRQYPLASQFNYVAVEATWATVPSCSMPRIRFVRPACWRRMR